MSNRVHPKITIPRDGQKVTDKGTNRDSDTETYKKPFQEVNRAAVVGNLNDEYYRHPPDNVTAPRDEGIWKTMPGSTPDPADPEVPKGLKDAVGEGGIGASLGREKKLDVQVEELEERDE